MPDSGQGWAGRESLGSWAERVAQLGSWYWTPATGAILWSENLFHLFGLDPDAVTPTTELVLEMTHPEDREHVERTIAKATREGVLAPLEYRIVRADGAVRHLRATMAIAEQADGGARQLMGALQDVTDWRRAEGEIQAHLVVDEVLENWDALDQGAELLLSRLAQSMDFDAGVLWIPQELELIPQGFWSSATLEASVLESTTKPLRLPAGDQVPARVWENLEPTVWIASPGEETHPRQQAAARAGLRSAIAFPAIGTDDVLAVIELFSRGEIEPARRLTRSLTGIGHELGRFLQGRRGALGPKLLTAREIQVLQLSANGSSGREIAAELVLSPATVKSHFENIYTKLSVSDRVSAVAIGLRQGFLD